MPGVKELRNQAKQRDKQAKNEQNSITKKSKGSHTASCVTTHDTGFKKTGSSVGPGGSHDQISKK